MYTHSLRTLEIILISFFEHRNLYGDFKKHLLQFEKVIVGIYVDLRIYL